MLAVGCMYLYVLPGYKDENAHFYFALLAILPYAIGGVFKSYSLRINRSARRARGAAEESFCAQLCKMTYWFIRLNTPIIPLTVFATKSIGWKLLVRAASVTDHEGAIDTFQRRASHAKWILPGLTTFMLLVKMARLNRKRALDTMKRKQTSPFKTILSITTAISASCFITGCYMVFWPKDDSGNQKYWIGITNGVLACEGIFWHAVNYSHWVQVSVKF